MSPRNAAIVAAAKKGVRLEVIAYEFKVPANFVRGVLRRAGIVAPDARSDRRERAIAMRLAGSTLQVIATELSVSVSTAYKLVQGLARKPKRTQPTRRECAIISAYRSGRTFRDVGKEFGIVGERVRQIVRRFGVTRDEGGMFVKQFLKTAVRQQIKQTSIERQERTCLAKWGLSLEQYREHVATFGNTSTPRSPMDRYKCQRANAGKRGIAWQITFSEWWRVWCESGRWNECGPGSGYCMARHGDDGPYSVDNVYICTIGQNFSDAWLIDHPNRAKARGFTIASYSVKDGQRFMACLSSGDGKRHFAGFPSREAAEQFATDRLAA